MLYNGYVYKCICLKTNKVYIGITIEGIEERKQKHIRESYNPNSYSYNVHFHRAIRKYGPENFEWTSIEYIKSQTRENLIYCLKQLEIKYIALYDSYRNGYNSTLGGDNSETTKKAVKVYIKDGTQIGEFKSIQDAADYYSVKRHSVGKCCNRVQKYVRSKEYGMLIFRFSSDSLTKRDLEKAIRTKNKNNSKVVAYYRDTNEFIESFESIKQGGNYFNVDPRKISNHLNGQQDHAGYYKERELIWRRD